MRRSIARTRASSSGVAQGLERYQTVSDGALTVITLDDLAEGDMVAVTTSEDGAQQIIVLEVAHVEDDLASSSSVSENAELATEESALEEATGE